MSPDFGLMGRAGQSDAHRVNTVPASGRARPGTWLRRALVAAVAGAVGTAATASGASSSVVVTMDVPSATTLATTGCQPHTAGVTDFGVVQPGATARSSADCVVSFGSSNDGASLRLAQSDGVGTAMARPVDAWTKHAGSSARINSLESAGGTTWYVTSAGGVRRSLDGGATWGPLTTSTGASSSDVDVPSASVAWVGGTGTDQVWRTTNGTAATPTWSTTPVAPGIPVRAVAAASDTRAWVAGDGGQIRSTVDGGTSAWTVHATGITWDIAGIAALDADSVVAWGRSGRVLVTSNGTTWRDITMTTQAYLSDVHHISDTHLVAVSEGGEAFTTTNATSASPTWTKRTTNTTSQLLSVDFADASVGAAAGRDGVLLRTSDGGVTWSTSDVGTSHTMFGIAWSGTALVAGGAGRNVVRSADGGATWTYAITGDPTWHSVAMTTDRTGWRVAHDGLVERTVDGGATWTTQSSPIGADLFDVHAFDRSRATAVGRGGTVLTTSDGGATWTVRATGVATTLWAVHGAHDGTAWAVGQGGTVLRTTDYGATWSAQSSPIAGEFLGIAAFDDRRAVATGPTGTSIRTVDGGITWVATTLPSSSSEVRHVVAARGTDVGLYTANGGYWRTTDAGASWTQVGPNGSFAARDLAMATPLVVIGVSNGAIRWSRDGGATWSAMAGNGVQHHWIHSVAAVDRSLFVAVGDGNLGGTTGTADPVADYQQGSSDWDDGVEAFGACLRATSATPTWTVNATCDQSADGAHWRGIQAANDPGSQVATTATGSGTRTASFRFGLRVDPAQPPGELAAGLTFVVLAPAA